MSVYLMLVVAALVCFGLATVNVRSPVNLTALGLALLTATLLIR